MTSESVKARTHILAFFSDTHCGSTLGLCPPSWSLKEGGTYSFNEGQKWLWSRWTRFRANLKAAREAAVNPYVTLVGNGDMTEGTHHGTTELVSSAKLEHVRIARKVLDPLVQLSDEFYVTRGTPSHVGQSAELEELVAEDLGAIQPDRAWTQSKNSFTHWDLNLVRHGIRFNAAHHGKIGRLAWTRTNGLNSATAHFLMNCLKTGTPPPHFILRAHNHLYVDTFKTFKTTRSIGQPGFQLKTGFIHKIEPGGPADVGWVIFTIPSPPRRRVATNPDHVEVDVDVEDTGPLTYRGPIDE